MPRKTRTAARAEEEIDVAVDTSGNSESASSNGTEEAAGAEQLTANKNKGTRKNQNAERQPLGEVVVNLKEESKKQSEITTEDIGSGQDENQTAKKKGKGGKGSVRKKAGKKTGKGKKTEEKHETEKNLNSMPEFSVVLDKNAIEESSASEGAAEQFKQPMSNETKVRNDTNKAPLSPAVKMTRRHLDKLESSESRNMEEETSLSMPATIHQPELKPRSTSKSEQWQDSTKAEEENPDFDYGSGANSPSKHLEQPSIPEVSMEITIANQQNPGSLQATSEEDAARDPMAQSPSQAVQKLEGLFNGSEPGEEEIEDKGDDIAEIIAKTPSGQSPKLEPADSDNHLISESHEKVPDNTASKRLPIAATQPNKKVKPSKQATRSPRKTQRRQKQPQQPTKELFDSKSTRPRPSVDSASKTIHPSRRPAVITGPGKDPLAPKDITNRPAAQVVQKTSLKLKSDGERQSKSQRATIAALKTPPKSTKSAKPATKPSFQLPGEAVAAKLKAEREDRARKQEHEESEKGKKPSFQARPLPKAKPVAVKETATSRARRSTITACKDEGTQRGAESDKGKGRAATIRPIKRNSTVTSGTVSAARAPRVSTLVARPREGKAASPAQPAKAATVRSRAARPSSIHAGKPAPAAAANSARPRAPSVSTARPSPAAGATTKAAVSARGKEVFDRDRKNREEQEKALREKQEAARRAREGAAERGRQASREWAERMMKRKEKERKVGGESGVGL